MYWVSCWLVPGAFRIALCEQAIWGQWSCTRCTQAQVTVMAPSTTILDVMHRHAHDAGLPFFAGGDWPVEPAQVMAMLRVWASVLAAGAEAVAGDGSVETISSHKSARTINFFLVGLRLVSTARPREADGADHSAEGADFPAVRPTAPPTAWESPKPLRVSFKTQRSPSFVMGVVCHPSLQAGPRKASLQGFANADKEWGRHSGAAAPRHHGHGVEVHREGSPSKPSDHAGCHVRPSTLGQLTVTGRSGGPRLGARSSGARRKCKEYTS